MLFHELDYVALVEPVTGPAQYGETDKPVSLPAGTRGTVVSVFDGACDVEFPVGPEISEWNGVVLLVRQDQIEFVEAIR